MLNVYHFVYRQYGFDFRPCSGDLIFLEWLGATNRLETYLKWKTANILARSLGSSELVGCPFDIRSIPRMFDLYFAPSRLGLLCCDNSFHRMKLARRQKARYVRFTFSLYQSKAASLPAPAWKIEDEIRSTILRLSTDKKISGPLSTPRKILTRDDVLSAIDRTVVEAISPLPVRSAHHRLPSRGACIDGSRANGGSVGCFIRNYVNPNPLSLDLLDSFFTGPAGVAEVRIRIHPDDVEWGYRLSLIAGRTCSGFIEASPVGLPEPFKVRVITKGEFSPYHVARCYQPRLWSSLQSHPMFQLIGTKVTPGIIFHRLSLLSNPDGDNWIVSGDYKQATDHIPSDIGNYCLEKMCVRLGVPSEDIPCLLRALTGHQFRDGEAFVQQRSGQLMGSPISFPVLCLINAALTRLALETSRPEGRDIPLSRLPMLINGDDLLFVGEMADYDNWKNVCTWAGLLPSVGKTIVSRRFGTINSQLFDFQLSRQSPVDWPESYWDPIPVPLRPVYLFSPRMDRPAYHPRHLPHVQLQLALGSMKSGHAEIGGKVVSQTSIVHLSRMWSEFMSSCPEKERAWRFLWGVNRQRIRSSRIRYPKAPLCLPPEAGGLGFPLPPRSSEYFYRRSPGPRSLLIARMLLEGGTEEHDHLRRSWLNLLNTDLESPSEILLFRQQCELQRRTGCPLLTVPSDSEPLLPPSHLRIETGEYSSFDRTLSSPDQFRVMLGKLRLSLDAYQATGRGPWDLDAVSGFLRRERWSSCYGRYSSHGSPSYHFH